MSYFGGTSERLDYEFDDERTMRGVQVVVEVDGERVLDVGVGRQRTGASVQPEHIFRVDCTIKPFLACSSRDSSIRRVHARRAPLPHLPDLRCVEDGSDGAARDDAHRGTPSADGA